MGQDWRLGAQAPLTGAWPGLRIISHGAENCKKDVLNILLAKFSSLKLTLMSKHWINWSMLIWPQKFLMTSLWGINHYLCLCRGCCIYCWLYQRAINTKFVGRLIMTLAGTGHYSARVGSNYPRSDSDHRANGGKLAPAMRTSWGSRPGLPLIRAVSRVVKLGHSVLWVGPFWGRGGH